MITDDYSLQEVLEHLPAADCNYAEWTTVGMALKAEGLPCSVWDDWSKADNRYHPGECERKWRTFRREDARAGSVIQIAMEHGWKPEQKPKNDDNYALDWDSEIGGGAAAERKKVVDQNWLKLEEVPGPPAIWSPADQVKRYLRALFEPTEFVGISTETYKTEDGFKPTKGQYGRTQEQIIADLDKYGDDLGLSIGDTNPEAGAWVRFNPLDGKGISDTNVTSYRYALIESDSMPIDKQYATLKEMQLPIRILVHSGKKSLHAIVSVEAASYDEYRKRVDYLYKICQESGLQVDRQNRNPSRLSRLPGVIRDGKKQYIVAENMGLPGWSEWVDYIQGINDDLPDIETFGDLEDLPPLAPELIQGILREGHKLLLSGPSKAGKSFLLMELAICIAEGRPWLAHECRQGRVLYINLEVDDASCKNRLAQIYAAMGMEGSRSHNLDIWNLRGASCPLDELTPRLIRRAKDRNYEAIIIDPLYKVITGDENSAEQMAKFCNLFDRISRQLSCAVIYCHHHSKGAQGAKRSMDRASGSGVFARDPDAIIDMIELEINETQRDSMAMTEKDRIVTRLLNQYAPEWKTEDTDTHIKRTIYATNVLPDLVRANMEAQLNDIDLGYKTMSAWRLESTLREFAPYPDQYVKFNFPIHTLDSDGSLKELRASGEKPSPAMAREARKEKAKEKQEDQKERFDTAFANANMGEPPTKQQMADYLQCSIKTIERNLEKHGYWFDKNDGVVKVKNGHD